MQCRLSTTKKAVGGFTTTPGRYLNPKLCRLLEGIRSKCSTVALKVNYDLKPIFTSRGQGPQQQRVLSLIVLVAGESRCCHNINECETQVVCLVHRQIFATVHLSVSLERGASSSRMGAETRTLLEYIRIFVWWQQTYDALRPTPSECIRAFVGYIIALTSDTSSPPIVRFFLSAQTAPDMYERRSLVGRHCQP